MSAAVSVIALGTKLPPIALPATDGSLIDLSALQGRVILFIYPWTGRPGLPNPPGWDEIPGAHGSTPEIEGFRDLAPQFAALGVMIFGLSLQTTEYQREMVLRLNVPFPILSDAEGAFGRALDLPSFRAGEDLYLTRLTLLIEQARIERVFYPVLDPAGHGREVLRWMQKERSGG